MTRLILKASIPFVEGEGNKSRPVIQLNEPSDEHDNFQVVFLTSKKPKSKFITDLEINSNIEHFDLTGLSKTTYIRASKIFTIDPTSVEGVLGKLPKNIETKLNQILTKSLNL
jgi:PemK-like, MazF-like toxin of type II toxin-antitoxin system